MTPQPNVLIIPLKVFVLNKNGESLKGLTVGTAEGTRTPNIQNRKQYIIKPYNPCGSKRFLYAISRFPPPFPPPIDLVPSNKAIPLWSVELSLWV